MHERIKEHDRDIRLSWTQTSAVSEHVNKTGREAIHIRLHPNNINEDSGIEIPEAWMHTIRHHDNQGAFHLGKKNPEISVGTKMDYLIGKKLFHSIVNPRTAPSPLLMWHQDGRQIGNNWNWYKVRETCKWNTKFRSENSNPDNGPTFLDFPLFQGIFQWDEPTKRFPFSTEPKFPKIWTKWKAPRFPPQRTAEGPISSSHNSNNALDRNPPIMSEVCDTPITNNHGGTNSSTQGVLTWEISHRREFHTAITLWFCISFTWWLDHFVISLFQGTLHDNEIYVWFKIANITHALPVPVHRFPTETCGRFAFTWYRCEISYRSEILAPAQQPGWLAPAWHFMVISCKQM